MKLRTLPAAALAAVAIVAFALVACNDQGGPTALTPDGAVFAKINSNDFYQCRTGNPRTECSWISGNLNKTHNVYQEDDVIPQKLRLNEAVGVTQVILEYGFRKGGSDAGDVLTGDYHGNYDFMARYDNGTGPHDYCTDRRMDPAFCSGGSPTGPGPLVLQIPGPGDPGVTTSGLTPQELAAYEAAWGRYTASKPVELLIFGAASGEIKSLDFTRSGDATTARMVFEFQASAADVLMLWGMHFAYGGDWVNAADALWHGASGQSGSPFHTKLIEVRTNIVNNDYNTGKVLNNGAMAINVSGDVVVLRDPSASISVALDGVNEVGDPHPVTATVMVDADDGFGAQGAEDVLVTFGITSGPGIFVADNTCTTDGAGECTVNIVSSAPGVTVVNATATAQVNGSSFNLASDGSGGNSGPLNKTWVDGYITITPLSDVNPVGEAHVFTATVKQYNGIDASAANVPDGTTVTFAFVTNEIGATFVDGINTCQTTDGQCTVSINSAAAGTVVVSASATFSVGGVSLTRTTDGVGENSGNASKTYAAARISVSPDGLNVVGDPHTFTAFVERNDGTGYAGVSGVLVTASTSGAGSLDSNTCTTDSDGTCDFTATSTVTGVMVINVSASVPANGAASTIPVSTVGQTGDYGPATKRWVQARLLLTPLTDTNLLGTPHDITATLEFDRGDGSGWVGAGADHSIGLAIQSGPGTLSAPSCTTAANSQCKVTLSNPGPTTTQTVVRGSWTGSIAYGDASVSASATTGTAPSSSDATKDWVTGSISLTKTVELGPFTSAPEICFTLSRTDGTLQTTSTNPQCHTYGSGDTPTSHVFSWAGLVAGTYSLSETTVPPPYTAIADITGITLTDTNRTESFTRANPLPTGALKIAKTLNGSSDLMGLSFLFDVEQCGAGSSAETCSSPAAIAGSPFTVDGANNPRTVSPLDEGWYRVTEQANGYIVNPAISQIVQVVAGNTANPPTVSFDNIQTGDVCELGKPTALILLYNGNGTANDSHNQDGSEVIIRVDDDADIASRPHPVTIRVYDHQDKVIQGGTYANSFIGQQVEFRNTGNKKIAPRAGFRVFLDGANINDPSAAVEHVQFHSSCSQPLAPGDEFGSFLLLRDEH